MTPADADALMQDPGIIRNRAKIEATIGNAQRVVELTAGAPGALDELMWSFAPPPRTTRPWSWSDLPAVTSESTALSKALHALDSGSWDPRRCTH